MFSPIWHSPSDRSISPVVAAENSFTGIRISFFRFPTETEVQHPPRNMPCPWCQISMGETFSLLERRNYQSSWHLQCESAIVGLFRTHRGTQSQTFPCNIYSLCGFCSCGEPTKCLVHQSITVSSVPARLTGWDIVFEKKIKSIPFPQGASHAPCKSRQADEGRACACMDEETEVRISQANLPWPQRRQAMAQL